MKINPKSPTTISILAKKNKNRIKIKKKKAEKTLKCTLQAHHKLRIIKSSSIYEKKTKLWGEKSIKTLILPTSDVLEKLIGTKVLDVDRKQVTLAPVNGVAAHLLQVMLHVPEISEVVHVDVPPHGGIPADPEP